MEKIVTNQSTPHQHALDLLKCGPYLVTGTFDKFEDLYAVTWVEQVSYDPPLVSIDVNNNHSDHNLIINSNYCFVHLLADGQVDEKTLKSYGKIPDNEILCVNDASLIRGCCVAYGCKHIEKIISDNRTRIIAEIDYSEINHTKTPRYLE